MRRHRRWVIFFGLWLIFLSGTFVPFLGSPGILQATRLANLLASKKTQVSQIGEEVKKLQTEISQLEKNPFAQEREIRRVLGYTADKDLVFEFTPSGL